MRKLEVLKYKIGIVFLIVVCCYSLTYAQSDTISLEIETSPRPNYAKLRGIFAAQSVLYLGTLYGLSKSWYKNPSTGFTFQDDTREWLQMDKMGHLYTSYQIARHTAAIYKTAGISKKQMLVYGAISGVIFQTPIEILDGFSPDYGFSAGDMVANATGSTIFLLQMALWDEIKIQPKFSAHLTPFAKSRPELLGENFQERLLKDYNGQTYWLSASPKSFLKGASWPAWLCLSAGYGIDGMVSAEVGKSREMGFKPVRKFYLSLDVDLTKIKSDRKFIKTMAFILNAIKLPAPAIEISKKGIGIKPLYF